MPSFDILNSHTITNLKKEISKTNIKGYSKMKKNEVIDLMLKNKSKFHHIKKYGEPVKKIVIKREPKEVKPIKKVVIKREPKEVKPIKKVVIKREPKEVKPIKKVVIKREPKEVKPIKKVVIKREPKEVKPIKKVVIKKKVRKHAGDLIKEKMSAGNILKYLYKNTVKKNWHLIFHDLDLHEKEILIPYLSKNGITSLKTWFTSGNSENSHEKIETELTKKYGKLLKDKQSSKSKDEEPKKEEEPKKKEEPKEKLIQLDEDKAKDRREEMNIKVFNLHNQNFHEHNKPQYKNLQEMEKSVMERKNKEASEKRANTRAKNEKKKQEEVKQVINKSMSETEFIKDFKNTSISDLGFIGNEKFKSLLKIINTDKGKYETFHITDFMAFYLGNDISEKLFNKYGVENVFLQFEKMIKKLKPNKKVYYPKSAQGLHIAKFNSKIQKMIIQSIPHGIDNKGKVYKTFEEWNSRYEKAKPKEEEEKDTNEYWLDRFYGLIKSVNFTKRTKGIQKEDISRLISSMINPLRYTTIRTANERREKINKAYTIMKNYRDNL
jgi:hypothetical protein